MFPLVLQRLLRYYNSMVLAIILLVVSSAVLVITLSLIKSLTSLPLTELKRRARHNNTTDSVLYRLRAQGNAVWVVLWLIAGLCTVIMLQMLVALLWDWLAVVVAIPVLAFVYGIIPRGMVNERFKPLTLPAARATAFLVRYSRPITEPLGNFLAKHIRLDNLRKVYSREHLLELLQGYKNTAIKTEDAAAEESATIAINALTYREKLIRDFMIPRRAIVSVSAKDQVGPVLLDELHKTGHSRFPVHNGDKTAIVGMLYIKDLVAERRSGSVTSHMRDEVYYVQETRDLQHVLAAFLRTQHHLFIVVNEFEDIVGIISIEDVLEAIIGKKIVDEFDKYDDLRAVAQLAAAEEVRKSPPGSHV